MEPALARASNSCTWDGLFELVPELRRSLARFDLCRFEIDDIVQETLLRAARYRHRLEDDERLRPWVLRIGVNVMRDRMRREARLPCIEGPDDALDLLEGREKIPGEGPEDDLLETNGEVYERALLMRHLESALEELPRPDRRVLARWYSCPDDEKPASRVCEHSPDLAKVHVFRARGRLVRLLRKRLALATTRSRDELPRLPPPSKERRGARRATERVGTKESRGAMSAARKET